MMSSDATICLAKASDATICLAKASDATICLAKASDATFCLANLAKDKAKARVREKAKVKAKDQYISLLLTPGGALRGGCVQLPLHHGGGALSSGDVQRCCNFSSES